MKNAPAMAISRDLDRPAQSGGKLVEVVSDEGPGVREERKVETQRERGRHGYERSGRVGGRSWLECDSGARYGHTLVMSFWL